VAEQRLGDLVADGEERIEARHRLLEDHRDVVAAHLAHLFRQRQNIAAVEHDLPSTRLESACSSRMIDSEVTLLPEPDSPTIATVSPGRREGDVAHDRFPLARRP
jgi:hypothetical protein